MQSNQVRFFVIIIVACLAVGGMFVARLFLVNTDPIMLSVLYSTEKEAWLQAVMADFAGEVNGRPVEISLKAMGSGEMYQAVLDGTERPDMISPASSLQISLLQDLSAAKFGTPVVDLTNQQLCRSVVRTPLVLVAWQERADVLWGDQPGADVWGQLQQALTDPAGWQRYNHPEWGYIKFGHTDPLRSNSGLMTIVLMTYSYLGRTSGLTADDLLSNQGFQQWFADFEGAISDFGRSTGTYMQDIVTYGPSRYDIVAVYESTAIEQIENAAGRYGDLRIYYPPATILSDHPFCVLQADWVTPEKQEAAQQFIEYLVSEPVQQEALALGFRPVNSAVSIEQANSPFNRYVANGVLTDLPLEVTIPSGEVLNILLNTWQRVTR